MKGWRGMGKKYCINCVYHHVATVPEGFDFVGCYRGYVKEVHECLSPENIDPVIGAEKRIIGSRRVNDDIKHYYATSTIYYSCTECRKNQTQQPSCGVDGDWFMEITDND